MIAQDANICASPTIGQQKKYIFLVDIVWSEEKQELLAYSGVLGTRQNHHIVDKGSL